MSWKISTVIEFLRRGPQRLKSLIETLRIRELSHKPLLEPVEPARSLLRDNLALFLRHALRQETQVELNLVAEHRDQEFRVPIHGLHASTEAIQLARQHRVALILGAGTQIRSECGFIDRPDGYAPRGGELPSGTVQILWDDDIHAL